MKFAWGSQSLNQIFEADYVVYGQKNRIFEIWDV